MRLGMRSQLAMVVAIAAALPLGLGLFSISFLGRRVFRAEKGALYQTMAADLSSTLAEAILAEVESLRTWIRFGSLTDMIPAAVLVPNDKMPSLIERALRLDAQWPDLDVTEPPLHDILRNDCSAELRRFQASHPLFVEILVADENGRLVAATNKTSDFYQGDETWWQNAQPPAAARLTLRGIEYDASARVHALHVAVPLPASGVTADVRSVAVMKAVLDVGPLLEAVARMPLPEQPRMHVVLDDGRVLANLSPGRGGLQLGDAFPEALIEDIRLPNSGWQTMRLNGTVDELVGFARLKPPRIIVPAQHMPPVDEAAAPIAETSASVGLSGLMPAYVIAHENEDKVLAPFAAQLRLLALLGLLVIISFSAAALWLAERRITRPLRLLRVAAQSIAAKARLSGDSDHVATGSTTEREDPSALLDRLGSVRTTDEIEDLSRDFGLMGERVLKYHEELEKEITLKDDEIQRDLEMAREFQEALLPRDYPVVPASATGVGIGLSFCHLYRPAFLVGGDFFNVARLSDTVAGVFVADVIGHGARSALVTAILRTLLQDLMDEARDPATLMTTMNAHFHGLVPHRHDCIFVTACYLVVDTQAQRLSFASAGHPSPLLIDPGNAQVTELLEGREHDPALGLFPDTEFRAGSCDVEADQRLLLYTDGVIEARNPSGDMYGLERLREDARGWSRHPDTELTSYIMQRVNSFLATTVADDDMCMVTVGFTPPPAPSTET